MVCRICGNTLSNAVYHPKEMMFGYKHPFTYFQCVTCHCLQIDTFPSDMEHYYPPQYYSFETAGFSDQQKGIVPRLKSLAGRLRNRYAAFDRGIVGKALRRTFPDAAESALKVLRETFPPDGLQGLGIAPTDRILDVGCGSGSLLSSLRHIGFKQLLGVDPYIHSDISMETGVPILKRHLHEVDSKWDVIMFHHSFEHMPDQLDTLCAAARLLSEGGLCLIRIPTVSSYAWGHYGVHWVQLDAPRHFYLHSVKSMTMLAAQACLRIEKIVYDSSGFQFWGSEQYLQDIPLMSES